MEAVRTLSVNYDWVTEWFILIKIFKGKRPFIMLLNLPAVLILLLTRTLAEEIGLEA